MKFCVTISLVQEARGGPFVFWDGLADGCQRAAALGFDAVEVFPPSAEAVRPDELGPLLDRHGLGLAAVGTGAGWVKHRLTLTDPDANQRQRARDFVKSIIDCAAPFGASAIIGSMQGRWGEAVSREQAFEYLAEAVSELGSHAAAHGVPLFYEPLNRYETNLCTTIGQGVEFLENHGLANVLLLADLFHMNIEESDVAQAIRAGGQHIGHVHFVDSNRQAAGAGHTDFVPIASALSDIGYSGYASAEAFPIPDSQEAARLTIEAFRKYLSA